MPGPHKLALELVTRHAAHEVSDGLVLSNYRTAAALDHRAGRAAHAEEDIGGAVRGLTLTRWLWQIRGAHTVSR